MLGAGVGDSTGDGTLGGNIGGDILGDGIRGDILGGAFDSSVFEVIPTSGRGKYLSKRV